MSTKKHTSKSQPIPAVKENEGLKKLASECATGVRIMCGGERAIMLLNANSLMKLLVKKGVITVDELRQGFIDEVKEEKPIIFEIAQNILAGCTCKKPKAKKKARKS